MPAAAPGESAPASAAAAPPAGGGATEQSAPEKPSVQTQSPLARAHVPCRPHDLRPSQSAPVKHAESQAQPASEPSSFVRHRPCELQTAALLSTQSPPELAEHASQAVQELDEDQPGEQAHVPRAVQVP